MASKERMPDCIDGSSSQCWKRYPPSSSSSPGASGSGAQAEVSSRISRTRIPSWYHGRVGPGEHRLRCAAQADGLSGILDIARSANAVMVSDGLTPGLALTAEPSIT